MTGKVKTSESGLSAKTRIDTLRKQVMSGVPRVCAERAQLMTESYKETEGEPMIIRRAKALSHILSNMTIGIGDDELIVGNAVETSEERGAPISPEYACDWLEDEIDHFEQRETDKVFINEEDKEILREIIPFWRGRTVKEKSFFLMPEELRAKYLEYMSVTTNEYPRTSGLAHVIADYEKLLNQGLEGITRETEEYLRRLDLSDPVQLAKNHFYRAVLVTHKAVIEFANRYANLARELERKEQNSRRKAELREIAEICEHVPAKPAGNFYEALQSVWFLQLALHIEAIGLGIAPGRMDQYLYSYYRRDIEAGRLNRERAKELVQCVFVKMNSFVVILPAPVSKYFAGFSTGQNIIMGGVGRDGRDATNELSYLMLEADGDTALLQPETIIRIGKDTPRSFIIKACEVAKKSHGKFKFIGDEAFIRKMLNRGHTLEDARDCCAVGCFEPLIPGKTSLESFGHINLPLCLELALNEGVSVLSGKQLGPRTGNPREFKSIQDVLKAFRVQLAYFSEHANRCNCAILQAQAQFTPTPLQSSLIQGCLESGADFTAGGALYNADWFTGVGAINVSDSVAAIKKCVFDEGKITMEELLAALHNNFEGKEEIRQALLAAPKFGNDDDYVDLIAREVISIFCEEVQKLKAHGGTRQTIAQLSGLPMVILMGRVVGASADGRKSGESIADGGMSPVQGRNIKGAAATYKSVAKLDQVKLKGGAGLNMRFSPDNLKDDRAMQKFATLAQTYFNELGGFHAQFNFVSGETLRDAQRNPDKYRDLLVRVATYTAYFNDLPVDVQNNIINWTELGVS